MFSLSRKINLQHNNLSWTETHSNWTNYSETILYRRLTQNGLVLLLKLTERVRHRIYYCSDLTCCVTYVIYYAYFLPLISSQFAFFVFGPHKSNKSETRGEFVVLWFSVHFSTLGPNKKSVSLKFFWLNWSQRRVLLLPGYAHGVVWMSRDRLSLAWNSPRNLGLSKLGSDVFPHLRDEIN